MKYLHRYDILDDKRAFGLYILTDVCKIQTESILKCEMFLPKLNRKGAFFHLCQIFTKRPWTAVLRCMEAVKMVQYSSVDGPALTSAAGWGKI